uniref:Tyrosine specific protein phosphatases domain-containing protein n=1 Tax=Haptolina ericina TaxID=156174 RepID=A0A7S3BD17_9EUKA|mmetsp:Transcript_57197/g.127692  ORF Transcript_57197/g.127692 Transcript_57197/m.127692 type:complete len:285 (+) Transcript_57197:661-1515(+)
MQVWFEKGGVNDKKAMHLTPERSFPVRAAYDWVNAQTGGAHVLYTRVPIADETAPEEQDFDQLVSELSAFVLSTARGKGGDRGGGGAGGDTGDDTALVFNCHMGRGRTTTGMVCGSIMLRAANGWKPPAGGVSALPEPMAEGRNLKRGEFGGILKLLASLEEMHQGLGLRSKLLVDLCADECDEVTSLVDASAKCLEKSAKAEAMALAGEAASGPVPRAGPAESSGSPEFWRHRGLKYLERYAYLLLFSGYALLTAKGGFSLTFTEWMKKHWVFKRLIRELVLS